MNLLFRLALAAIIPASLVACSKTAPILPGPVASLEMPSPPARLLIPVELPAYVEPEPEPVEEPAPVPSPARAAAPARSPERSASAPATPTADAAATPPPVLQTTKDTATLEQKILAMLNTARQNLDGVTWRDLGATGRAHYDQAKNFIRMANEALKIRNFMYAEQLASKAAIVAALLIKG